MFIDIPLESDSVVNLGDDDEGYGSGVIPGGDDNVYEEEVLEDEEERKYERYEEGEIEEDETHH